MMAPVLLLPASCPHDTAYLLAPCHCLLLPARTVVMAPALLLPT